MTNVIPLASRRAAPTPAQGAPPWSPRPPFNCVPMRALSMALHYLRQPRANVPGAARKAVQALAALRSLDSADVCTSPSTQGGAA